MSRLRRQAHHEIADRPRPGVSASQSSDATERNAGEPRDHTPRLSLVLPPAPPPMVGVSPRQETLPYRTCQKPIGARLLVRHNLSRKVLMTHGHTRRSRRLQGGNDVESEDSQGRPGECRRPAELLSACVLPEEVDDLDRRVSTLEDQVTAAQSRAAAAESRASQLETAANLCTNTCQEVRARLPR
jgi:hypothetical protein